MNNETLNKLLLEELNSNETQEKISKAVDGAITEAIHSYFGWNGEGKKTIGKIINPYLKNAIEKWNLENYLTKMNAIINEALRDSKLDALRTNTLALIGGENKKLDSISLKDLFKKYVEEIKQETISYSDIEDTSYIDDGRIGVECNCEVKHLWGDTYEVKFTNDIHKLIDEEKPTKEITFKIRENRVFCDLLDKKIDELRYSPKTLIDLLDLYNNETKITGLESDNEYIDCEVEY